MKLCDPHFDLVEKAVIYRGLGDLIPQTPAEDHAITRHHRTGKPITLETFDPLCFAAAVIMHQARRHAFSNEACPLCEFVVQALACRWVDLAADAASDLARTLQTHVLVQKP